MRWLVMAVLLSVGCEVDPTSSPLDWKPDNVSEETWNRCAAQTGTGNEADFSRCLKGAQVTPGDAGTSD